MSPYFQYCIIPWNNPIKGTLYIHVPMRRCPTNLRIYLRGAAPQISPANLNVDAKGVGRDTDAVTSAAVATTATTAATTTATMRCMRRFQKQRRPDFFVFCVPCRYIVLLKVHTTDAARIRIVTRCKQRIGRLK